MLTIGKLSKATGVKVPTIRYYEQIDLLPEPVRTTGNQRLYDRRTQERLAFIRHARDLGFPLEAIRELLGLSDDPHGACAVADDIARRQLAAVEARIARLTVLRDEFNLQGITGDGVPDWQKWAAHQSAAPSEQAPA